MYQKELDDFGWKPIIRHTNPLHNDNIFDFNKMNVGSDRNPISTLTPLEIHQQTKTYDQNRLGKLKRSL